MLSCKIHVDCDEVSEDMWSECCGGMVVFCDINGAVLMMVMVVNTDASYPVGAIYIEGKPGKGFFMC